ncbi:MAG: tRNA-splicing ligase [Myxococcales bacterium SG8_38]|nr:MAG: tRNA-splicing ligase [Myxococcales bacterium SG8_38]
MDITALKRVSEDHWELAPTGKMRVPVVFYADRALLEGMDDKVQQQARNVASLPGIVKASYVMPDGHWGYGFPIGGVGAFDAEQGGVVSAGGVGFDISCGVRCLLTGLRTSDVEPIKEQLADALFERIPAGVGSTGRIHLDDQEMTAMLEGGARWAVDRGWGRSEDLERIEEHGCMRGAEPQYISEKARHRQRDEMGTLGSGNHYLEVQRVAEVLDPEVANQLSIAQDDVVVSIHCGSRGLGHQVGTEFLREMALAAEKHGIELPDLELACAPLRSEVGRRYLGAMRAGINCALANRQIITHLTREVFSRVLSKAELPLLYDVSHNTCKEEEHIVDGVQRHLFVHRKGATRAFGPGHPDLPEQLSEIGQPVLIGGSMGTESWLLVGTAEGMSLAFGSACHGAGRRMSRHAAKKQWRGSKLIKNLAHRGIIVRSVSMRGVAEEAPGAYKDVRAVVDSADRAGLARKVARLQPMVCIKG